MGKRIDEARAEVRFSGDILDYYARNAESFLAPATLHPRLGEAHIESSPLGVLFCVEPWNFPYYQVARFAAPNLMIGNTIILKHAPQCPESALAMEQIVNQAAKMRFMLGGKASVPLVMRFPCGSGTGAAAQHSQSLEAWFAHVPGL